MRRRWPAAEAQAWVGDDGERCARLNLIAFLDAQRSDRAADAGASGKFMYWLDGAYDRLLVGNRGAADDKCAGRENRKGRQRKRRKEKGKAHL